MAASTWSRTCASALVITVAAFSTETPLVEATPIGSADTACDLQAALPSHIDGLEPVERTRVTEGMSAQDLKLYRSPNSALGVWIDPVAIGLVQVKLLRASFEARVRIDGFAMEDRESEIVVSANEGVVLLEVTGIGTLADQDRLEQILEQVAGLLPDECVENDDAERTATIGLLFALAILAGGPALVRTLTVRRQQFHPPNMSHDQLVALGLRSTSFVFPHKLIAARRNAGALRCGSWWIAIATWAIAGFETQSGRTENGALIAWPVSVLVVVGGHLLARRQSRLGGLPRRRAAWLRIGRFRALSWLLVLVAAWLLWLGLIATLGAGHRSVQNDIEMLLSARGDGTLTSSNQAAVDSVTSWVGLIYVAASIAVFWIARRIALLDVDKLLQRDRRRPILMLRSFSDDNLRIRASPSRRHGFVGRLGLRPSERFEELLAWVLSSYGPVVAVQDPTRKRRRLGAARETIDGVDWLESVRMRVGDASLIVLVVGEPSASDGLASELEMLKEAEVLDKVVFILPPVSTSTLIRRWWDAARIVGLFPILPAEGFPVLATKRWDITHFIGADQTVSDLGYETAIDIECERRGLQRSSAM